jgi:hypothetical protein
MSIFYSGCTFRVISIYSFTDSSNSDLRRFPLWCIRVGRPSCSRSSSLGDINPPVVKSYLCVSPSFSCNATLVSRWCCLPYPAISANDIASGLLLSTEPAGDPALLPPPIATTRYMPFGINTGPLSVTLLFSVPTAPL